MRNAARLIVLILAVGLMRMSRRSRARWHLRRAEQLHAAATRVPWTWGVLAVPVVATLDLLAGLHDTRAEWLAR